VCACLHRRTLQHISANGNDNAKGEEIVLGIAPIWSDPVSIRNTPARTIRPQTICQKPSARNHLPETIYQKPSTRNHLPETIYQKPSARTHLPESIWRKPAS